MTDDELRIAVGSIIDDMVTGETSRETATVLLCELSRNYRMEQLEKRLDVLEGAVA